MISPDGSSIRTAPEIASRLAPIAAAISSTDWSGGSQTRSHAHRRPATGGSPSWARIADHRSMNACSSDRTSAGYASVDLSVNTELSVDELLGRRSPRLCGLPPTELLEGRRIGARPRARDGGSADAEARRADRH